LKYPALAGLLCCASVVIAFGAFDAFDGVFVLFSWFFDEDDDIDDFRSDTTALTPDPTGRETALLVAGDCFVLSAPATLLVEEVVTIVEEGPVIIPVVTSLLLTAGMLGKGLLATA
jgi:hypothetical protein